MTSRIKLLMSFIVIAPIGCVAWVGTLTDVSARIREHYPSASVSIHEGHSPGIHPVLDVFRMVRGKSFIPDTEWISVQLTAEDKPIDFASLFQFKVQSVQLTHCKVNDMAPLLRQKPLRYAVFINCDLSSVPADQKAALIASAKNPERFFYGSP